MDNVKFNFTWMTQMIKRQLILCIGMNSLLLFVVFGSAKETRTSCYKSYEHVFEIITNYSD